MRTKDIIIIILCVVTALACVALTFWGNIKNDGILTTDAYIGVVATLIGVCATIVVGFQIASFIKIQETECQIKDAQKERDDMLKEKEEFLKDIEQIRMELSNTLYVLSETLPKNDETLYARIFAKIVSITLTDVEENSKIVLKKYQSLKKLISQVSDKKITRLSRFRDKLKRMNISNNIEYHTEIMNLHWEIIGILDQAAKMDGIKTINDGNS